MIYLYHADLYSDLWKSGLYFRPAKISLMTKETISKMTDVELWDFKVKVLQKLFQSSFEFRDRGN